MIKKYTVKIINFFFMLFFIFFILDLLVGNYVYKKILRKNYFDVDLNMGEQHPVYNHGLKKNYNTNSAGWGKKRFSFCTDNYGFRNKCNFNENSKNFDIGVIGDSFIIGFGLSYEELFTTRISKKLKNKKIANLAASSYAPSIYYSKIKYLLDKDFKFNEIIVFVDLSDLHDDITRYQLKENRVLSKNNNWEPQNSNNLDKLIQFLSRKFKVTNYLILAINEFLINNGIKNKSIPRWVLNNPRSSWTYNYEKKWYEEKSLEDVINNSISHMEKLYKLLKKNNISLSVAVYPYPSTLLHDKENNLQVQIWENFCLKKCKFFYNFMHPFFEIKKKIGFKNLYFKYYIDGDIHFNENGNEILAESFIANYKN